MSTFHEALEKLETLIAARRVKPMRQRRQRKALLELSNPQPPRQACRPVPMRPRADPFIPKEAP